MSTLNSALRLLCLVTFLTFGLCKAEHTVPEEETTVAAETEEVVAIPTYEAFCEGLKNGSVVKKTLYYECLPLVLGMTKAKQMFETEDVFIATLVESPIPDESKLKINIAIEEAKLISFSVLDTSDYKPDVQLQLTMSWQDDRLKWNAGEWKFSTYPVELKPETHIWGPKFTVKGASALSILVEAVSFFSSKITNTGNVTTSYLGQITFDKCSTNLASYPYDLLECCTEIVLTPENKITLDLNKLTTSWDMSTANIWTVKGLDLKVNHNNKADQGAASGVNVCVKSKRNTAAVGSELSLPMAVSAIVLMCAQLAGKWKMQVYVKLFAILIQIFAFQNLVPNDTLMNATKLPRIYVFYNFTVAVTIFSLCQTMLFWALSRRWFLMPPPHRLTLSMKVISRFLLGDKLERVSEHGNGNAENQLEPKTKDNRKEWETIFGTIHAVLSLIIIAAYIIGIIVIYASNDY